MLGGPIGGARPTGRLADVHLVPAMILSASGVIVATAAFLHRRDPRWLRSMPVIMGMAIMQVMLGVVSGLAIR
jgi:hypothetical protein